MKAPRPLGHHQSHRVELPGRPPPGAPQGLVARRAGSGTGPRIGTLRPRRSLCRRGHVVAQGGGSGIEGHRSSVHIAPCWHMAAQRAWGGCCILGPCPLASWGRRCSLHPVESPRPASQHPWHPWHPEAAGVQPLKAAGKPRKAATLPQQALSLPRQAPPRQALPQQAASTAAFLPQRDLPPQAASTAAALPP